MSFDSLQAKIDQMQNPTVVGLDPDLAHIPEDILGKRFATKGKTLESAAAAVLDFNYGLIDALCDIVPAVKPQSAYYEALGPAGVAVLKQTCDYA
jgi:orotidine-5'-phosphate decarboxylase